MKACGNSAAAPNVDTASGAPGARAGIVGAAHTMGTVVHDERGDVLDLFSPPTREWFSSAFAEPTPAQDGAWRAAQAGEHSLVIAPTGSGKTLAAFLWALDRLASTAPLAERARRCRVLYVSPLKALAVDVQRNLRAPLAGMS